MGWARTSLEVAHVLFCCSVLSANDHRCTVRIDSEVTIVSEQVNLQIRNLWIMRSPINVSRPHILKISSFYPPMGLIARLGKEIQLGNTYPSALCRQCSCVCWKPVLSRSPRLFLTLMGGPFPSLEACGRGKGPLPQRLQFSPWCALARVSFHALPRGVRDGFRFFCFEKFPKLLMNSFPPSSLVCLSGTYFNWMSYLLLHFFPPVLLFRILHGKSRSMSVSLPAPTPLSYWFHKRLYLSIS